jgi:hypothetical protein
MRFLNQSYWNKNLHTTTHPLKVYILMNFLNVCTHVSADRLNTKNISVFPQKMPLAPSDSNLLSVIAIKLDF